MLDKNIFYYVINYIFRVVFERPETYVPKNKTIKIKKNYK